MVFFFFSSRRRHTRFDCDWSSDVCSSDLSFRAIIASGQVEPLVLPARSPNLNAYAERWVRSVKEECLCKVILFGERSLPRAIGRPVALLPSGGSVTACPANERTD